MITKRCSKCKIEKNIIEFSRRGYNKDGSIRYQSVCKTHEKEYTKNYNDANKEKRKQYYKNNKIKLQKQYKERANRTEYYKIYRKKNKEKIKQCEKKYREKNREKINERKNIYYKTYRKKKCETDLSFRLRRVISTAFYIFLKKLNLSKKGSFVDYFSYDSQVYIKQIENTFEPWMSWENYGSLWHIDHIISLASFVIPEKNHIIIQILWHPLNLRALNATQNIVEGCRTINVELLMYIISDIEVNLSPGTKIDLNNILQLQRK